MNNPLHQHIDPELLVRFLLQEASVQEQHDVSQWLEADPQNRKYFEALSTIWHASAAAGDFNADYLMEDWKKVSLKIAEAEINKSRNPPRQRSLVFQLARIAAVFVFLIGFYFLAQKVYTQWSAVKVITSSTDIVDITLPDGSRVSLNANSKLTYPETFDAQTREVTLEGEAFFEVAENKQQPFIIKTGTARTEVVGTSFTVNDNVHKVVVTVLTGKVLLYKDRSQAIAMVAGEQGIYSDQGLEKKINDDPNFMSWKTKELIFQNTALTKVVDDLNRHYGQHMRIASDALAGCTFTSTFKDQTLEEILHELTVVFSIEIERTPDGMIIKGKGC